MNSADWTWVGSRSTGTSHLKSGTGCDDFGACIELRTPNDTILIAVASDGAGSARFSSIGSWIATRSFIRCAVSHFSKGELVSALDAEILKHWIDEVRDNISLAASKREAKPRDFAATFVGAVVGKESAKFCHVGDGAAVYMAKNSDDWIVASWPAQGEFAATTYFVTDDPEASVRVVAVDEEIESVAVFTDGIERLVLNFTDKSAHAPFFERMFSPIQRSIGGRDRSLSRKLREFLDGPTVCEKTDDDKTLILAKRRTSV